MTMTSDSSVGTNGRHAAARPTEEPIFRTAQALQAGPPSGLGHTRDADASTERGSFASAHPVVFGLMGVLIALMLTFAALQALMVLLPNGVSGA